MKHLLLLTLLFPIVLLACGDGVDIITKDVVENVAGCYDQMETTDNHYIVSLDRNCIDLELGQPITAPTPAVTDNPVVAIPTDAEWELIATLQRNPLKPASFYLFDEDNDAIAGAYIAGKHFIFEIGSENRGRQINQARYYIIQPMPPFKEKDVAQSAHEERTGFKSGLHVYHFETADGWFVPKETRSGGGEATGIIIEFSEFIKPTATIKLNSHPSSESYIKEWARLRVYVSR